MKIKMKGNPPGFVKEYVSFQESMPHIQMGVIPEGTQSGYIAIESIPLNSFIAAFLNEIWDHQEKYLKVLSRNLEGNISDQDKMQIIWNTMSGFMESVALHFEWKDEKHEPRN